MNTFQQIVFACALTLLSHLGSMIAKAHFLLFLSFFLGGGGCFIFCCLHSEVRMQSDFFPSKYYFKEKLKFGFKLK